MSGLDLRPRERHDEDEIDGTPASPLDQIRQMYRKAQGKPRLRLPAPGELGEVLKVRYKPLPDDFREQRPDETALDFALDVLITCCDGFEVRSDDGWGDLLHCGEAVMFDETLVELFCLPVPASSEGGTARQTVLAVYGGAPKPGHAAIAHLRRLLNWMSGGRDLGEGWDEEIVGES